MEESDISHAGIHEEVAVWRVMESIFEKAFAEINAVAPKGQVPKVILFLLHRIVGSTQVLMTLGVHHKNPYEHDAASILRSCYDAYIQAAFILVDPKMAEERAQDYLDFFHVERHQQMRKLDKTTLKLKDRIMNSPLRAKNGAALEADFLRVRSRFETQSGGLRKNWYKGDLRQLAEKLGETEEYDFVLSRLHPSVHSSAFALETGAGVPPQHILFFAQRLAGRIVKRIGALYGITFKDELVREALDSLDQGVLE